MTLRDYFARYWRRDTAPDKRVPYVRWYTKFKPIEFVWADDAFISLAPHWSLPYFLPNSQYLLPYCPPDRTLTPVWHQFPAKGLFISGAGARTRLHKDPWASDAVLCQMYGEKRVVMYSPDKEHALKSGGKVVDIEKPDPRVFTNFKNVTPDIEDVLRPGEILFIPAGWLHHVNSLTNSISITWNFVSIHRWTSFLSYLLSPLDEQDRAVLRYFANPQAISPVTESVA